MRRPRVKCMNHTGYAGQPCGNPACDTGQQCMCVYHIKLFLSTNHEGTQKCRSHTGFCVMEQEWHIDYLYMPGLKGLGPLIVRTKGHHPMSLLPLVDHLIENSLAKRDAVGNVGDIHIPTSPIKIPSVMRRIYFYKNRVSIN